MGKLFRRQFTFLFYEQLFIFVLAKTQDAKACSRAIDALTNAIAALVPAISIGERCIFVRRRSPAMTIS